MELKSLALCCAIIVTLVGSGFAQTPPAPVASPIKIGDIRIESAALPGSSLPWTKIVIGFSNTETWADGISFAVQALLGSKDQYRVITGGVRFGNVPKGTHNAILYISPRAAARFGKPVAVQVTALYKDTEADVKSWKDASASISGDWQTYNTYPGILVNILSTPWIMIDYEKQPDVLAGQ